MNHRIRIFERFSQLTPLTAWLVCIVSASLFGGSIFMLFSLEGRPVDFDHWRTGSHIKFAAVIFASQFSGFFVFFLLLWRNRWVLGILVGSLIAVLPVWAAYAGLYYSFVVRLKDPFVYFWSFWTVPAFSATAAIFVVASWFHFRAAKRLVRTDSEPSALQ